MEGQEERDGPEIIRTCSCLTQLNMILTDNKKYTEKQIFLALQTQRCCIYPANIC